MFHLIIAYCVLHIAHCLLCITPFGVTPISIIKKGAILNLKIKKKKKRIIHRLHRLTQIKKVEVKAEVQEEVPFGQILLLSG
jgi:predicted nucleotide-binding protein (sugar kinase/HSP70/actin superfamily)